jgi:hypothetical protein
MNRRRELLNLAERNRQRGNVEDLPPKWVRRVINAIVELTVERLRQESFFKWNGAVFISAIDIIEKMDADLLELPTFILQVEKFLSWDVSKSSSLMDRLPRTVARGVSKYYQDKFHLTGQIPQEENLRSIWNGVYGGNGIAVLIMPENHTFADYNSQHTPRNTSNFNIGILRDLDRRLERRLITLEQYQERRQSLIPPNETPSIEDQRPN